MAGKTLKPDIELNGKLNPSTTAAFTKLSAMATKTAKDMKINKIAGSIGQAAGVARLGMGVLVAGAAAAASAFTVVATKGIMLASNLAEVQNVVDVTFGKDSKQVDAWSKTVLDAYGLSELSAKKYSSTIGAMLKSSGVSTDNVLKMSTGITQLTGDMASFYNLDTEAAFEKIRSGISGETEPLKQLGINMSVANMEAFALSTGIKTSYAKMDQAAQSTLRYNYLMKVSADAQGDFTRTQGGFANQMRLAKEKTDQLFLSIGTNLLPVLTPLIQKFNDFISTITPETLAIIGQNITDIATGGLQTMSDIFTVISPIVMGLFNFLKDNGELIKAVFLGIAVAVGILSAAQLYLNILAWSCPFNWILLGIIVAIGLVTAAIYLLATNWDTIVKWLGDVWNGFVWGMSTAWNAVWGTIVGAFKSYMNIFIQGLDFIIGGMNLIPGVNIPIIPVLQGGLIPGLAIGATVNRATLAMIGEAGTETVVPHNSKPRSQALALEAARGAGVSTGNNINITFAPVINGGGSVKEDLKQAYNEFESQIERYFANKERVSYGV